jgi:hypothetical protein
MTAMLREGHQAGCQLLMTVIPATQEAEIRRIVVQSQPRQTVLKTLCQKTPLVEWLKMKALSSSPNTAKKKNKKQRPSIMCPPKTLKFYSCRVEINLETDLIRSHPQTN